MLRQALPHEVERRTSLSSGDIATIGFTAAPIVYVPAFTPPEFAAMIADVVLRGDTSRIQSSYFANPERRQRPSISEKRSSGSTRQVKHLTRPSGLNEVRRVTMDLVAPDWALEITRKAEERGRQENAIRRANLLKAILD